MFENNNPIHELYALAEKYQARVRNQKIRYTEADYRIESRLCIIATNPPIIARPIRWQGEAYKSPLKAWVGDKIKIVVSPDLIYASLVLRHLNNKERRVILRNFTPPP